MHSVEHSGPNAKAPREIELPAPAAWPITLAFGLTLVFAGLVTNISVSVLGAVLSLAGCVSWFREFFRRNLKSYPVVRQDISIVTSRRGVDNFRAEEHARAWLPLRPTLFPQV
jgi:hypothetical protein